MRVLFTSMRLTGHLRPLLPYASALMRRGHAVLVAAPADAAPILRDAGIDHAPFAHPGDAKLGEVWALEKELSAEEFGRAIVARIFADLNPRAALPGLRETVRTFKPDLIVRESAEYAGAVAAAESGLPVARVAVNNGHMETRMMALAQTSVDVLRQEAGLGPDGGAALRAAPAFTAFPRALDGDAAGNGIPEPLRIRTGTEADVETEAALPAWAADDGRPLVFITSGRLPAPRRKPCRSTVRRSTPSASSRSGPSSRPAPGRTSARFPQTSPSRPG